MWQTKTKIHYFDILSKPCQGRLENSGSEARNTDDGLNKTNKNCRYLPVHITDINGSNFVPIAFK